MEESSKGSKYLYFNPNLTSPSYLNDINVAKYRHALITFRLSNHRLAVETGRWHKPHPIPYSDRKCPKCNILEDEFHFLFECQMYNELRNKYIPKFYVSSPSMEKFIQLASSNDKQLCLRVSSFIYKAYEIRKTVI